ncbi:MAG: putative quinol monooxygenase [Rikenellaceae bacterium]
MIRINAFFQINEGATEQFLAVVNPLVAASQAEAGCIAYDLFASTSRPDVYIMCETWADAAAVEAHNASAHFTAAHPLLGEVCSVVKVESFDMDNKL